MEIDQRDREKSWTALLNPIETRIYQELKTGSVESGAANLHWLDSELPDLKDASNYQINASQLDSEVKAQFSLSDEEAIFLIFPANTEIREENPTDENKGLALKGQIWFTSERVIAARSDAAVVLFYSIALNTLRLSTSEESHLKETIHSWLSMLSEGKIRKEHLIHSFAYESVSDLEVLQLGNPRLIVEVSFKTASPMSYYKVTFGRSVIPEKVWLANSFEHGSVPIIFCQPYPLKQFAQEALMEKHHALMDTEYRLVCSTYANAKMFIDALRRPAVPKQEQKECSMTSTLLRRIDAT
jgi:hypothetical protein